MFQRQIFNMVQYPVAHEYRSNSGRAQIERRLAPFWKGLDSHDPSWTDYQFACAFRGLPVPDSRANPPDGFFPPPLATSPSPSGVINTRAPNSFVPALGLPDYPFPHQPSTSSFSNPVPPAQRASSPFKSHGTRLAAALSFGSSRSPSEPESSAALREVMLPPDAYLNGQPIEGALYRRAIECPICFLSYPPYLNYTRCCLQPICSECFVQIKRPDPHLPEHHVGVGAEDTSSEGNHGLDGQDELVSEPSTCPYCQQSELGVTYDPPPFRRGLVYAFSTRDEGISDTYNKPQMAANQGCVQVLLPERFQPPPHKRVCHPRPTPRHHWKPVVGPRAFQQRHRMSLQPIVFAQIGP